jgi:adenosylcobinamide kinase/adenosylcobinamide-phosphate guanylyltransferase
MAVTLILGGARSGKSRFAENLACAGRQTPVYIATAEAGDAEMHARITEHQARRGSAWTTVEEPLDIAELIAAHAAAGSHLLVDCLTLWLSNLMAAERDAAAAADRLASALAAASGDVTLVSNEVGLGIVPMNALARDFRDEAGRLNQRIAQVADTVFFMVAGLPLALKQDGIVTATGKPQGAGT